MRLSAPSWEMVRSGQVEYALARTSPSAWARRALASLSLSLAVASAVASTLGCRPKPAHDQPDPPSDRGTALDDHAGGTAEFGDVAEPEGPPRPAGAIFRHELHRATQDGNPAYLLAALSPDPYRPQGRFEGWVITRLWPQDPQLCAPGCDLYIGDVILSVNGSRLQTPEELSNMLERLDELERLDVRGIRDGEYFERSFPIVDSAK